MRHSPLLHFVVLGALLFGAERWWSAVPQTDQDAVASAGAAVDDLPDDEILFREALHRDMDRDKAVRARLVALGRFLGLADGGDDAAVEREARALGLQRTDLVVRRHLIEMMRLSAAAPNGDDLPSEAALLEYYARHADRFAEPARIRLIQVYLSADRRGDAVEREASEVLATLRDGSVAPADAPALGDPFVRGAELTLSPAQFDAAFGAGFGAALADLPARTWVGPLRSAYGLHLLWIADRFDPAPPPLASVRTRVLHAWLHERREARLQETVRQLRARYGGHTAPVS